MPGKVLIVQGMTKKMQGVSILVSGTPMYMRGEVMYPQGGVKNVRGWHYYWLYRFFYQFVLCLPILSNLIITTPEYVILNKLFIR